MQRPDLLRGLLEAACPHHQPTTESPIQMTAALTTFLLAAMLILQPGRDHQKLAAATASVLASEPPLFADDDSHIRTAALVVAIQFSESSFRNDIISKTNDGCAMQIHNRPDLAKDAVQCVRVGLKLLRASVTACPSSPLANYAGFRCSSPRGRWISENRLNIAARLLAETAQ